MTLSNSLQIAILEIKHKVAALPAETTLEDKLTAAMRDARHHWMVTNEDEQFRAAVGAVMLNSDDDTRRRIEKEMLALRTLGTAMDGVPVDFSSVEVPEDPIGLLALWKDTKVEP